MGRYEVDEKVGVRIDRRDGDDTVVLTLGILQYQWTGEIGQVEQARMEGALDTSVKNFSQEFAYDFDRLCESFELNPTGSGAEHRSASIDAIHIWIKTTTRSGFVSGIYVWKRARGTAKKHRITRFG